MHRLGHYGVSLLVFAPLGFALVQTGHPELALVAGAAMWWLAMLPDVDIRVPGLSHRGPTHTLLFAALVGATFGGAGVALADTVAFADASTAALGGFGFVVGALVVVAHLLGDVLTPMGVRPFWPVSNRTFSLRLWTADSRLANYALFALGVFVVAAAGYLSVVV